MILRVIRYNRVEIFLISSLLLMQLYGGIWSVALWSGLALSAWWVIMTSTNEAQYHAREMVRHRQIYPRDTAIGGLLLLVLAYIVRAEDWFFSVMYILAAAQHLRYTYMISKWVKDIEKLRTNDKM